ncbi:hypothetical protein MLDJOKPK_00217 [Salmonella phage SPAsTU]|nr:hypothetical protein STsAS_193 [Salmonella phage STsAS]AWN09127.1 hypothetical protein MLDJOKPK_00217 [Salmonella phage SPAsTU]
MKLNNLDGITSQIGNAQNTVNNAANRVQSTVADAERGIQNAQDTVSSLASKAGETFNKLYETGSGLGEKIGNLFGGSDTASVSGVKTAGSAASGVSPPQRIPTFASDTKNALPVLDPQKRDVSEPFQKINQEGQNALSYLSPGGAGSLLSKGWSSLMDIRDNALSAIGTDYASVKSRLESTMNIAGQLAKLPSEVAQEVNNYMSIVNSAKYEVTSLIDDVTHTFDSFKDLDDYLSISNLIDSFKGTDSFSSLDINTSSALIYGISTKLNQYGLPDKVDPMIQAITDPVAQQALYGELMVQAAASGNLTSVEYYLTKLQPGQGAELADTVIQNLLANLTVETGVGYRSYGTRLLALFNALDPNWDHSKTIPSMIELKLYSYANSNAIQALLTTEKRPYVIAGGSVQYQSASSLVQNYFPV